MAAEYRLDIHTAAGVKVAEVTDFIELAYTRRVNAPGLLTWSIMGNHEVLPLLEHNGIVIVYRRNASIGLPWTADFWGLYRAQKRWYTDHDLFEARCPGVMTMLTWRIVAWYANTANRSKFKGVKAETIAKTLVSYNAGSAATTANGRIRDGAISGISVQADAGSGNTLNYSCAWDNLLSALQTVASIGGGDFDLAYTGAGTYRFDWHSGQLGTDRTGTLLFALERGNMAEPVYEYDRQEDKSVGIAGGQGEEDERVVRIRTSPSYNAASNNIETFIDGRNCATEEELNTQADARLADASARQKITYRVVQTPACAYGVHYQLGDLIKAQYSPIMNMTQKIEGVDVSLGRDGGETIAVEMRTL